MRGRIAFVAFGISATILIAAPLVAEGKKLRPGAAVGQPVPAPHENNAESAAKPVGVLAIPASRVIGGKGVLPVNTEVTVSLDEDLSSKDHREGDAFSGRVVRDVEMEGIVVIPAGTPVQGVISMRSGKGAFGKSAKMEIAFQSIDLNGQVIPVKGRFHQAGRGRTGATLGAAVAVGVFAAFVRGGNSLISKDEEIQVLTKSPLPFEVRR